MTAYALVLWAYKAEGSALSVSLLSLFSCLPYAAAAPVSEKIARRLNGRTVLLATDAAAEACTAVILLLFLCGRLSVSVLYPAVLLESFMNALQSPVAGETAGSLVPKEQYGKLGGMNSFSASLTSVAAPVFAASLLSFSGLFAVLLFDVGSFFAAFTVLVFFVRLPEENSSRAEAFHGVENERRLFPEAKKFLPLFAAFAVMNFFSAVTYENLLPAMLLARTAGNDRTVGTVSAVVGAGGLAGSLLILLFRLPKDRVKTIFFCAAFTFLFGDLLMGFGRNEAVWIPAAVAASVPVSFISSAETTLIYERVPEQARRRAFALKNAFQLSARPVGFLLGGVLADFVFEPYLKALTPRNAWLVCLVGCGRGSGMAAMFLCTGILGAALSAAFYPSVRKKFRTEDKNIV